MKMKCSIFVGIRPINFLVSAFPRSHIQISFDLSYYYLS